MIENQEDTGLLEFLFYSFLAEYAENEEIEEVEEDNVALMLNAYMKGAYDAINALFYGVDGFSASATSLQEEAEAYLGIEYEDEEDQFESEESDFTEEEPPIH